VATLRTRFFDPGASHDSALYANGLHFSTENRLLVKNLGNEPTRVKATLLPLDLKSPKKPITIPERTLVKGEAAILDLPLHLGLDVLEGSAIKVEHSGSSGALIAAFSSFEPGARITRYVPFKDVWDLSVTTGGYPWRLDGDYESRVYITNIGNKRSPIGGLIHPEGGEAYLVDTRYLEAGETAVFDILKIRDLQIPDTHGITLPKDVLLGNFEWSMLAGGEDQRFIGRNDVESRSAGVSSSFSCAACNCPWNLNDGYFSPANPFTGAGSSTTIGGTTIYTNPCGGGSNNFTFYPSSWYMDNSTFFSMTVNLAPTTMAGLIGGSSGYYSPLQSTNYQFNGQSCFSAPTRPINPGGTGTVQVPDHLAVNTDTQQTVNCGSNPSTMEREITYFVQDVNNALVIAPFLLRENVPTTVSSCNGGTLHTGSTCSIITAYAPNIAGEFTDVLMPGCPSSSANTPCGFTFANQQWQSCPSSGQPTSIGTIGLVEAKNWVINVAGNSVGYVQGKVFYK
jgi:hypothetical protein